MADIERERDRRNAVETQEGRAQRFRLSNVVDHFCDLLHTLECFFLPHSILTPALALFVCVAFLRAFS